MNKFMITLVQYLLLGGDHDEFGCKSSAGYNWCNETHECIPINQVCSGEIADIYLNLTLSPFPVHEV